MPTTPDPLRSQLAGMPAQALRPSGYPGYRKGRTAGSSRRGRVLLILIFCVLRVADALVCFSGPASARSPAVAAVLIGALWTTSLMVGIWFRQEWCRWALMVVLLLSILSAMFFLRDAFDLPVHAGPILVLLVIALINSGAAWGVIQLRDIRRLTSRSHASRPYGYT